MGSFELLGITDSSKWTRYFESLPPGQQDIYYTPEYYSICEMEGKGKAQCFVFRTENEIALYPFLLNVIDGPGNIPDKKYFDIQGAYGYNGVISSSYEDAFARSFSDAFEKFAVDSDIIAEFTRFNPVLKNHLFSSYLNPSYNQENIIVDLSVDSLEKDSYEYSTRKNINKAVRNNLQFLKFTGTEISAGLLEQFLQIYYATMRRNGADETYYFPLSYFESVAATLGEACTYYFISYQNTIIAAELVLLGKSAGYSFLGGTLTDYYEYRPNDFLKHKIIEDLRNRGFEYFCLGGGGENLIRYKKSFAKNGSVSFYIGRKIYNPAVYEEVVRQWTGKNPDKSEKYKNIFLKYRM